MRFKVEYVSEKLGARYWRTINADTHSDAMKIADRYTKRGYVRVFMQQVY